METNVSSQASTENKHAKNKIVAVISRWFPRQKIKEEEK